MQCTRFLLISKCGRSAPVGKAEVAILCVFCLQAYTTSKSRPAVIHGLVNGAPESDAQNFDMWVILNTEDSLMNSRFLQPGLGFLWVEKCPKNLFVLVCSVFYDGEVVC